MSMQEVNNEYVILTENLCKDYTYYKKEVGLKVYWPQKVGQI